MRVKINRGTILHVMLQGELTKLERLIGVRVDEGVLAKFLIESKTSVPHLAREEQYAWAILCAKSHPNHSKFSYGSMIVLVITLILMILFSIHRAHGEGIEGKGKDKDKNNNKSPISSPISATISTNPLTVIPIADNDKVKLLLLLRKQDLLLMDKKDADLKSANLAAQINDVQGDISATAQAIASTSHIDTTILVLDLSKLAWVSKEIADAKK